MKQYKSSLLIVILLNLIIRVGIANYTTSKSGTSMSSCLAISISSFTKIIQVSMYNNTPSYDASFSREEADLGICDVNSCLAISSFNIAKITNMPENSCINSTISPLEYINKSTSTRVHQKEYINKSTSKRVHQQE